MAGPSAARYTSVPLRNDDLSQMDSDPYDLVARLGRLAASIERAEAGAARLN